MIERAAVLLSFAFVLIACADAHDVDAITPSLRDDDAGSDDGASSGTSGSGAGSAGRAGSGSGTSGSGSSTSGSGAAGRAGSGSGTSGNGSSGSGSNASSCQPCSGFEGTMGALDACCTADGECGLDLGPINGLGPTCAQQNAPGMQSTSCPAYVFGGNFDLTSCCGADGFCGVMIMQTAPLGCVDPALLGDLVEPGQMSGGGSMFGGGMFGQGQSDDGPVRCGGRRGN